MMRRTEWAYTAGIIDGEGCIDTHGFKGGGVYLRIRVGQKDPKLIRWLQKRLGGRHYHTNRGHHQWIVSHKDAIMVLEGVLPYLTVKRPQAMAALRGDYDQLKALKRR
jgi:hypothetical protein